MYFEEPFPSNPLSALHSLIPPTRDHDQATYRNPFKEVKRPRVKHFLSPSWSLVFLEKVELKDPKIPYSSPSTSRTKELKRNLEPFVTCTILY